MMKDANSARVRGLSFKITSDPLFVMGQSYHVHRLCIDAWEYTIQNDSMEFPVLSMRIADRFDANIPEEFFVSDIKALSCPVDLTEKSVRRSLQLARFLVRQIQKGFVPDTDKSLRMYRLHPVQFQIGGEMAKSVARSWTLPFDRLSKGGEEYSS